MIQIYVKTQFEALHRWVHAPEEVAFLRDYHRHCFHVKVGFNVTHSDRDIEFFIFKKQLDKFLKKNFEGGSFNMSCEDFALSILRYFRCEFVEVSEDGDNGAVVSAFRNVGKGKKTVPFYGTEAEGPFYGAKVLFIPGSCNALSYADVIRSFKGDRIYYGAGNDRNISVSALDCINKLLGNDSSVKIDVEMPLNRLREFNHWPEAVKSKLGLKLCFADKPTFDVEGADYIKWFDGESVVWADTKQAQFIHWLRDPLFALDRDVE